MPRRSRWQQKRTKQPAQSGGQPRPDDRRTRGRGSRPPWGWIEGPDAHADPFDDVVDLDVFDGLDPEPEPEPGDFVIEPDWDDPEAAPFASY